MVKKENLFAMLSALGFTRRFMKDGSYKEDRDSFLTTDEIYKKSKLSPSLQSKIRNKYPNLFIAYPKRKINNHLHFDITYGLSEDGLNELNSISMPVISNKIKEDLRNKKMLKKEFIKKSNGKDYTIPQNEIKKFYNAFSMYLMGFEKMPLEIKIKYKK